MMARRQQHLENLSPPSPGGAVVRPRERVGTFAVLLLVALLLGACGSDPDSTSDPGSAAGVPSYEKALAAAPPKLQALYADGSEVLPGGAATFEERVSDLRGYPIVVNNWASWCVPCREEFPYLQSQAAEHLDEVAFLGVDSEDSEEAVATFLRDHPIPYPSIADPGGDFSKWVDEPLRGIPNTLFFDRAGELVYVKQGPFADEAELAAAIEKYALAERQ